MRFYGRQGKIDAQGVYVKRQTPQQPETIQNCQMLHPNAGQGIKPQRGYLTALTLSQLSDIENVKCNVKQKDNRTVPEV